MSIRRKNPYILVYGRVDFCRHFFEAAKQCFNTAVVSQLLVLRLKFVSRQCCVATSVETSRQSVSCREESMM